MTRSLFSESRFPVGSSARSRNIVGTMRDRIGGLSSSARPKATAPTIVVCTKKCTNSVRLGVSMAYRRPISFFLLKTKANMTTTINTVELVGSGLPHFSTALCHSLSAV